MSSNTNVLHDVARSSATFAAIFAIPAFLNSGNDPNKLTTDEAKKFQTDVRNANWAFLAAAIGYGLFMMYEHGAGMESMTEVYVAGFGVLVALASNIVALIYTGMAMKSANKTKTNRAFAQGLLISAIFGVVLTFVLAADVYQISKNVRDSQPNQ